MQTHQKCLINMTIVLRSLNRSPNCTRIPFCATTNSEAACSSWSCMGSACSSNGTAGARAARGFEGGYVRIFDRDDKYGCDCAERDGDGGVVYWGTGVAGAVPGRLGCAAGVDCGAALIPVPERESWDKPP